VEETAIFRKCAECSKDLYRTTHCVRESAVVGPCVQGGVRAQGDRWIGQLPPFLRVRVIISLWVQMNFSQAHQSHVLSTIVEEGGGEGGGGGGQETTRHQKIKDKTI
jgi:hypothetical protein